MRAFLEQDPEFRRSGDLGLRGSRGRAPLALGSPVQVPWRWQGGNTRPPSNLPGQKVNQGQQGRGQGTPRPPWIPGSRLETGGDWEKQVCAEAPPDPPLPKTHSAPSAWSLLHSSRTPTSTHLSDTSHHTYQHVPGLSRIHGPSPLPSGTGPHTALSYPHLVTPSSSTLSQAG